MEGITYSPLLMLCETACITGTYSPLLMLCETADIIPIHPCSSFMKLQRFMCIDITNQTVVGRTLC